MIGDMNNDTALGAHIGKAPFVAPSASPASRQPPVTACPSHRVSA
jgi:hypothetical protein